MSGIVKRFGAIPPYKYDVAHRPWFEGIKHQEIRFWPHIDYITRDLVVAMTRGVHVGLEKKFVFGVDISQNYFERIAGEYCNRKLAESKKEVCGLYHDDGGLIYHTEHPITPLYSQLTLARTEPALLDIADFQKRLSTKRCFSRVDGTCIIEKLAVSTKSDYLLSYQYRKNCHTYIVQIEQIFGNQVLVVLRDRTIGSD